MQSQSISMQFTTIQSASTGKTTKVKESNFDNFMSKVSSNVNDNQYSESNIKADEQTTKAHGTDEEYKNDGDYRQRRAELNSKTEVRSKDEFTEEDFEKVEEKIVDLLEDTFGMSRDQVEDIMNQLGITCASFTLVVTEMTIDATSLRAFVMEAHGIEDVNAFLTSDKLVTELNNLMNGIEDILDEMLGIDMKNLNDSSMNYLKEFSEKFSKIMEDFVNGQSEEQREVAAETQVSVQSDLQDDLNAQNTDAVDDANGSEITIEVTGESKTGDSSNNQGEMSRQGDNDNQLNTFVENLNQNFNANAVDGEISEATTGVSFDQIVNQVVKQIKIRVMPQTTSMELMLNPATLGRVNLSVMTRDGVATATLTVQNEYAKEALESQIVTLRENLENQGLKVESVEVNVSNFGFKNQEDSNNQNLNGKPKKRIKVGRGTNQSEEVPEEENDAATNPDGVVDFTA
ncbi:MAG: flagellar hook-length control protein FliK [Eubacterium sp.]|nr:flagellar hook-length control protein FliK [Eubacterium sp.]